MTAGQVFLAATVVCLFQWLLAIWIKGKVQASIKHGYDKRLEEVKAELKKLEQAVTFDYGRKLEEFKFDLKQREQASMIAELLAEWLSDPADTKRLNQLTWAATLWLPAQQVKDLAKTFSKADGAKPIFQLLVDVRKILKGSDDSVDPESVIHFPSRTRATRNDPRR